MNDRYLWDGSEPADPEVQRLERLLGRYRHVGSPPALPRRMLLRPWMLAAGLAAAAAALVWVSRAASVSWRVHAISGSPSVGSRRVPGQQRLRVGQWLETDEGSRARLEAWSLGTIEIAPNSRLRLVSSRMTDERLSLERGSISATISAPPRLFSVDTPWATAVDLGCEYTLSVAGDGSGELAVSRGWVELAWGGRESIVPAGDICSTRPGRGPGTPRAQDAPRELIDALERFDFGPEGSMALPEILAAARPRDSLALWHVLARTRGEDRVRVYERLVRLSPPPAGVTREGALALDSEMLDSWRFKMGTPLSPRRLSFWRVLWARLTR